jgi:hypothetical protein
MARALAGWDMWVVSRTTSTGVRGEPDSGLTVGRSNEGAISGPAKRKRTGPSSNEMNDERQESPAAN